MLLHGNSSSSRVFARQFRSPLARRHRLIAIDLPGHGRSADAADPVRSYSLPGYSDAVLEAIGRLGVPSAVFYGWSLGGHVALEIASRWDGALGVLVSGAPPATPTPEGLAVAFQPNPAFAMLSGEMLTDDQQSDLANVLFDGRPPTFARADVTRTDGRARRLLFEGLFSGQAADERLIVERSSIPVAILDGEHEPFANPSYLDTLDFGGLPGAGLTRIGDAGHAPFWQNARAFNAAVAGFLATVAPVRDPAPASFVGRPAGATAPLKAITA